MRAAFSTGEIVLSSQRLALEVILLDSGALGNSYISSNFYEKHQLYLKPLLKYTPRVATLANGTPCATQHSVLLNIELPDRNGIIHSATIQFLIFPMSANQMIIGLPSLLLDLSAFWISKLQSAVELLRTCTNDQRLQHFALLQEHLHATESEFQRSDISYGTVIENPWSTVEEPAPEDYPAHLQMH